MSEPKINFNDSVTKNLKIIYGSDCNLNTKKEAEMAEAFLKFAKPQASGDEMRLYMLKQSLGNYYAIGESAVLLHYAKEAYNYVKDKGSHLYAKIQDYVNNEQKHNIAQSR